MLPLQEQYVNFGEKFATMDKSISSLFSKIQHLYTYIPDLESRVITKVEQEDFIKALDERIEEVS